MGLFIHSLTWNATQPTTPAHSSAHVTEQTCAVVLVSINHHHRRRIVGACEPRAASPHCPYQHSKWVVCGNRARSRTVTIHYCGISEKGEAPHPHQPRQPSIMIIRWLILCLCVAIASGCHAARGAAASARSLKLHQRDLPRERRGFASRLLSLRGGNDGAKGEQGEGERDEDVEVDDGDGDDGRMDGAQQNQMVASIGDLWSKTPPMTQVYVGSSLLLTVASFLLNKNSWPDVLNLEWGAVLTKFQLWRPLTSFLFFGPLGLNYLLTIHFVWTYMAQLEKLNYKKPEEFFVMMAFGAVALLVGYTLTGLSPKFLGHNLSTFLVYIWARIFEGTDVNVMVSAAALSLEHPPSSCQSFLTKSSPPLGSVFPQGGAFTVVFLRTNAHFGGRGALCRLTRHCDWAFILLPHQAQTPRHPRSH